MGGMAKQIALLFFHVVYPSCGKKKPVFVSTPRSEVSDNKA